MASNITHTFISGKADDADNTLVRPSDWNADHTITSIDSDDITGTEWTDLTDGGETTLHSHAGAAAYDGDATSGLPGFADADATTKIWEHVLAGDNITITEQANGESILIAASSSGESFHPFLLMGA